MKTVQADFGKWFIQCIPEDGARISVLKYDGHDLLTSKPESFKPPEKFYGEFETRPVYGYDDCFPSVDPCIYPSEQFGIRDHGELCWQEWKVVIEGNSLSCQTFCAKLGVTFKRILEFSGNSLNWRFEVKNDSLIKVSFLHVMHALLSPEKIRSIKLPGFRSILDEVKSEELDIKDYAACAEHLLSIEPGIFEMLLLNKIKEGEIKVFFHSGLILDISFDNKMFPTLGIWWNNAAYPEEVGIQRSECAFEPIPGTSSDLSKSFSDGSSLNAGPGETIDWKISWTIKPQP